MQQRKRERERRDQCLEDIKQAELKGHLIHNLSDISSGSFSCPSSTGNESMVNHNSSFRERGVPVRTRNLYKGTRGGRW